MVLTYIKSLQKAVIEAFLQQRSALILWMPVFLGCGIALYFSLRFEPPAFVGGAVWLFLLSLLLSFWFLRAKEGRFYALWLVLFSVFLISTGFSSAQWRTMRLGTVMLEKEIGPVMIEGRITDIDRLDTESGLRVVLSDIILEDMGAEKTPQKVRIKFHKPGDIKTGDRISALVKLNAPSAPIAPLAFDFQRYAYFKKMGAFGFAFTTPEIIERADHTFLGINLEVLRQFISTRVSENLDSHAAPVVVALLTGERSAIRQDDWEAMRASGLAHLLAISGLHVGLITGVIFFFVRFLMAALPNFALHYPIKKYAAFIALLGGFAYTLLVGATIPTVRALMMVSVVLFAVIIERMALSLRLVALAAFAILLMWPESLWSISFQMSFAAVTALIVFYDKMRPHISVWYHQASLVRKLALYVLGLAVTSVIATLATSPFALFHFQQMAIYGLIANIIAVPLMAFIVMPMAVLAYLLMALGLVAPVLWGMETGVIIILDIAHEVAALSQATIHLPAWPLPIFAILIIGALFLLLWQGRGRLLGVPVMGLSIIMMFLYQPADLLVSSSSKLMAYRDDEGSMHLSSRMHDRFVGNNWLQRNGQDGEKISKWPREGEALFDPQMSCDDGGCHLGHQGKKIAFSYKPETHGYDCGWADIVIAKDPIEKEDCAAMLIIDKFDTYREGAHTIWLDGRYETVQMLRGTRPWTISNRR